MNPERGWWRRIAATFRRRAVDDRLAEEIEFHLEQQAAKHVAHGMAPDEARRAARRQFGNVGAASESARDESRWVWLEDFARDLHIALRGLHRVPGFAIAAGLTLALGVGASTTMFSVINGVLLQPLPYPESNALVRLFQIGEDGNRMAVAEPNFLDWQARTQHFSRMAASMFSPAVPVVAGGEPHMARVAIVTTDFFDVMRVHPALGRGFRPDEQQPGAAAVAIVSDAYWNRIAGGPWRSGVTARSGSESYDVIGVMPPGFAYPAGADVWLARGRTPPQTSRTAHNFAVIARVRDGSDPAAAHRELSEVSRAMKSEYGEGTWMHDALALPLREQLTAGAKPTLTLLSVAALLLLVIACINVSSLMLARMGTRQREIAVRRAMGAGAWRVARQLLAESLVLCALGGAAGVALAAASVRLIVAARPASVPRIGELSLDWWSVAFAGAAVAIAAMTIGGAAIWRLHATSLNTLMTGGARSVTTGHGRRRAREALVVMQIALTLTVLAGAGLLARSLQRVVAIDPGYRTDDALVVDVVWPPVDGLWRSSGESESARRWAQAQESLMSRLRALPNVEHVGLVNDFPVSGGYYANGQFIEMTHPDEIRSPADFAKLGAAGAARTGFAGFRIASEDYFAAMGIGLVRGRLFDATDASDATVHVAVISRSLAETRWPDRDPLGTLIQFGNMDGDLHALRVVGIVDDVREFGLEAPPGPLLYALNRQRRGAATQVSVVVRGPPPASIAADAQRIVREVAPESPVSVRTVEGALDLSLAGRRFSLTVITAFAAVALVLATLGLYGLIAYLASERHREMGIRMALGASSAAIARLIVARGAVLAAVGTCAGIVGAIVLGRAMRTLLFGVSWSDPPALIGVVCVMGVAVLLASYIPAFRASRLPPASALRSD